jgi:hypothetical protein
VGANQAGLTALLDQGAGAPIYVAIGDGPTAADEVSAARVQVVWAGPVLGLLTATGVPYDFTGPSSSPATHALFFTAAAAGTFLGFQPLDGDQAFSAAGAFRLTSLTLATIPYDPDLPAVPTAPFALGSVVGVPTGTTLTDRATLGAPTATETFVITHPVTEASAELDVTVWRDIRFTSTITPNPDEGETYLFENCSFEGLGNWCVEVNNSNATPDVMLPLVVFNRCSFDGGSEGNTDKCMIGGYCWVIDCDMRGAEDGWAGWYYCVGLRSNFVAFGATVELHSDGVQCLDTGRATFYQSWISAGVGPGASQAFRVGTEAGAAQDIDVRYCGIDRGGYAMQFRGDSGAGDITGVKVIGCRWTHNHEFGPIDIEETTIDEWSNNAYFDGEPIPAP